MSIAANTQELEIEASSIFYFLIISRAGSINPESFTIGNVGIFFLYIDLGQKMFIHEISIALRMVRIQTDILVQIESADFRKVETFFFIHTHEFVICCHRGRTGSQA